MSRFLSALRTIEGKSAPAAEISAQPTIASKPDAPQAAASSAAELKLAPTVSAPVNVTPVKLERVPEPPVANLFGPATVMESPPGLPTVSQLESNNTPSLFGQPHDELGSWSSIDWPGLSSDADLAPFLNSTALDNAAESLFREVGFDVVDQASDEQLCWPSAIPHETMADLEPISSASISSDEAFALRIVETEDVRASGGASLRPDLVDNAQAGGGALDRPSTLKLDQGLSGDIVQPKADNRAGAEVTAAFLPLPLDAETANEVVLARLTIAALASEIKAQQSPLAGRVLMLVAAMPGIDLEPLSMGLFEALGSHTQRPIARVQADRVPESGRSPGDHLAGLKELADVILISAPTPDALTLARWSAHCDAIYIVIHQADSPSRAVQRLISRWPYLENRLYSCLVIDAPA